jgi:serine/threonine protein kinase
MPEQRLPDLGSYEALFRIGAGGMGEVYAARRQSSLLSAELVAVKRLFPHLVSEVSFADMLLDEARIARSVLSPYVVRVIDVGRARDRVPYLVMELITGSDLGSLMMRTPLPLDAVLEWLSQAAQGLHAAHGARSSSGELLGLVHRDVSPENLLIGLDGIARVADFGIAYARDRLQPPTALGRVKGKLSYMSPEQAAGDKLDLRSDIFSLGIVAWEATVRQRLFDAPTAAEVVSRVRDLSIPHPRELRSDVPVAVGDAILKALARDRERRFPTAQAFAEALQAATPQRRSSEELAVIVRDAASGNLPRIRTGLTKTWPQAITVIEVAGNASQMMPNYPRAVLTALLLLCALVLLLSAYMLTR